MEWFLPQMFNSRTFVALAGNDLRIGAERDLESQCFNLAQMLNRSIND